MEIIIDKIAIWQPNLHDGFTVRTVPIGTRYLDPKTHIYLISDKIMYRYAKNYKVGKTRFCLFARTFRDDDKGVEKELNEVAKTITEEYAKSVIAKATFSNFEYTDNFLKGVE